VNVNVTHILHLVLNTVLLLCGLFMLVVRGAKPPTIYMALARLFPCAVSVLNFFQYYNMPFYGTTLLNPLHLLSPLVTIPLQYAYIFSLIRPDNERRRFWFVIFIPPVLFCVLYCILILTKGNMPVIQHYSQLITYIGEPELWLRLAASLAIIAELIVLSVKGFRMQRQHVRNLPVQFSYTEGISLWWIRWVIVMFLIRGCSAMMSMTVEGVAVKQANSIFFIFETVITTTWVLRQKNLYGENGLIEKETDAAINHIPFELSSEKNKKLKQDLLDFLEKDEIFKDPELNIEKVRAMLHTNRTYLSQLINHEMGVTFYQLINNCRLNKATAMMRDTQHKTVPLKNIAEICGFKSMSAFSNLFKQSYGKTPTEWRQTEV
jgi:AraC-like DNA-binding protein